MLQSGSSVSVARRCVVPHSCAAVWLFFSLESLWPDAAVVKHNYYVVWQLSPQDSVWPGAVVVLYSCILAGRLYLSVSL